MMEFLIAHGHPPESVQEYSWGKLTLFHGAAQRRVQLERLQRQEELLRLVALAQGVVTKKGAKAVNMELEAIRQQSENLVASKNPKALIEGIAEKLMKSGIPRR